jgi:hypothetical protein
MPLPISDRTKSFAAVAAILAVALCNVVFGMDWVVERPVPQPVAAIAGVSEPQAVARPPIRAARPAPPAAAAGPPIGGNAAAAPDKGAPRPDAAVQMTEPATQVLATPAPTAPPPAEAAKPKCDVVACAQAYRSFQESDCTWQPFEGPRRLCTKGTEAAAKPAATDANTPGAERCNQKACTEAYISFNPSDCTYQPLDGPRRLCEK